MTGPEPGLVDPPLSGRQPGISKLWLALRSGGTWLPTSADFDPIALQVPGRDAVEAWRARLDDLGQPHGGIIAGHEGGSVLVGPHDPDGIESACTRRATSNRSGRERTAGCERVAGEPFADQPVGRGVGVQGVGQRVLPGVLLAVQRGAVEEVQVRVVRPALGQ